MTKQGKHLANHFAAPPGSFFCAEKAQNIGPAGTRFLIVGPS